MRDMERSNTGFGTDYASFFAAWNALDSSSQRNYYKRAKATHSTYEQDMIRCQRPAERPSIFDLFVRHRVSRQLGHIAHPPTPTPQDPSIVSEIEMMTSVRSALENEFKKLDSYERNRWIESRRIDGARYIRDLIKYSIMIDRTIRSPGPSSQASSSSSSKH